MMLQQIDKKKKIIGYFLLFFLLTTFNNLYFIKSNKFNLINIYVSGLDEKINLKILQDLKIITFENIFFLNKDFLKNVIESYDVVGSYKIKKIYPNSISVDIKKTEFLAITYINQEKFLIGSNSKLIKYDSFKKDLPVIFGKMEINNFLELIKALKNSNFNINSISEFYSYPSGRWDIKTKNNLLYRLPREELLSSLDFINEINKNKNFDGKNIIDLRNLNYLILSNEQ